MIMKNDSKKRLTNEVASDGNDLTARKERIF